MKRKIARIDYSFIEMRKKQYIWALIIVPLYVGILRYCILEPALNMLFENNPNIKFWVGPLKNFLILVWMIILLRDNIRLFWKDFISSGIKDDVKWIIKSIYYFFIGRVIYAILFMMTKLMSENRFIALEGVEPQNERYLDSLLSGFPAIAIIQTVIIAPILEELIFRYVIYHFLRRINRELAIVLSSLFFSVLHILTEIQNGLYLEALYFGLSYMVIALVLAIIYERRKNIIFCMILHMFNNALSTFVLSTFF